MPPRSPIKTRERRSSVLSKRFNGGYLTGDKSRGTYLGGRGLWRHCPGRQLGGSAKANARTLPRQPPSGRFISSRPPLSDVGRLSGNCPECGGRQAYGSLKLISINVIKSVIRRAFFYNNRKTWRGVRVRVLARNAYVFCLHGREREVRCLMDWIVCDVKKVTVNWFRC